MINNFTDLDMEFNDYPDPTQASLPEFEHWDCEASMSNIFQQSQPTLSPRSLPPESAPDLLTVDSGRSSMVTPGTTWGSPREASTTRNQSNAGISYPNTGNVLSPTNVNLKRSLNDRLNDENKKWKTCDENFDNSPVVVQAGFSKSSLASIFPSTNSLPNYTMRTATFGSNFENKDGLSSLKGYGENCSANGVSLKLFGLPVRPTCQPISVNKANPSAQLITKNGGQGGVHSNGGKCSPQTSNALQNTLKKHGDSQVGQEIPKSAPINIETKDKELSIEEERKKKQQEKNRQYAKESRDRKNEKLKKLEQESKEKQAEIEIMKKVMTIYHVKLRGSEPEWTQDPREWFPSNGGNSQMSIVVAPCLPNDEEILRELGNSPYGSVVSPVKTAPPAFKRETVNASGEAKANLSFSPGKFGREVKAFPGNAVSHLKSLNAPRTPSQPVYIPRQTDSCKRKPEASLLLEMEQSIQVMGDLLAHRQEDTYTVGLFSGHRTEVKPHKKLEEQFLTPWSASYPDHSVDVVEEEVATMADEETRSATDQSDTSPDALIDEFRNLPSWDLMRIVEEAQMIND